MRHPSGERAEFALGKPQQSNLQTQPALNGIHSLRRLFEKVPFVPVDVSNSVMLRKTPRCDHLTVIVSSLFPSFDNVLPKQRSFILFFLSQKMPEPLTLGLFLSNSDIEWSHLISISKERQENHKTCTSRVALLYHSQGSVRRKRKEEAREWQRMIREAGEAKGETRRKMKRFVCQIQKVSVPHKGCFLS